MAVKSAGILLFKYSEQKLQVLLAHPGGPFWKNKDKGAWTIPKGQFDEGESPLNAAKREFEEELGSKVPQTEFIELGTVKLKSGKTVYAWAAEADFNESKLSGNTFEIEWPPKSGTIQTYPEVDRVRWLNVEKARQKIHPAQSEFIDRLLEKLNINPPQVHEQIPLL